MLPKPGHEKEHLWALITAPDPETRDAIFYADARMVDVKILEEGLSQGLVRQHAALSAELIQRTQDGLIASRFTPDKIKEAFKLAQQKGLA